MRPSSVFGSVSAGMATVAVLYACGGDTGSTSGATTPPAGATATQDGAVIDLDAPVEPDGPVDAPDANVAKVDVTTKYLTVAGNPRKYVLSVPKTYSASRQYPLILALHGDGGNADDFRISLGLDDVSGDDAIVAYPDGVFELFKSYDQNGDQQLVEAVIADVKNNWSIDDAKVWAFGYSKGGFMINELACRKPGMLKAIAGHACGGPQKPEGPLTPEECPGILGLPVMITEGDQNTDIGGASGARFWATVNNCGTDMIATTPEGCEKYTGCDPGKPVTYCLAAGVSHSPIWAGAVQASWDFFNSL
jgi:polyhydroxybutyrate depolymerase